MEIKLHWAQQPFYKQPNKRFSSYLKCLLPEITDHFSLFLPLCKPPCIHWLNCYQSPSSAMKENQEKLKKKWQGYFIKISRQKQGKHKVIKAKGSSSQNLTLYTLTSVCIFSILFSINFLWFNKENFSLKNQECFYLAIISFLLVTLTLWLPEMIYMQLLLIIYTHYPVNRWWEYLNLSCQSCHPDLTPNSHH